MSISVELIPFHRPLLGAEEAEALAKALADGRLMGNGPIGRRAEAELRRLLDVPFALLTSSCTSAIELALMVLGVGPGDEVLLPSFTFVSCATAVARAVGQFKDDFRRKDLETFEESDVTMILHDREAKGRRLEYVYDGEEWRADFYALRGAEHVLVLSWYYKVEEEDHAEALLRVVRETLGFDSQPAAGPAPKGAP